MSVKLACSALLALSMLQIPAASSAFAADTFRPGQILSNDGMLVSSDGRFALVMQSNGDLVLYNAGNDIWSTNTDGQMYNPFNVYPNDPFWLSYAHFTVYPQHLRLNNNGQLYVSDQGHTFAFWTANTDSWMNSYYTPPRIKPTGLVGDTLVVQNDGNCVLYDTDYNGGTWMPVWATNTGGR